MAKRQRKKSAKGPAKEVRVSEHGRETRKETVRYKRQQTPKPLNLKRTSSFLYIAKPKRAQETVEGLWKKARKARKDQTIPPPIEGEKEKEKEKEDEEEGDGEDQGHTNEERGSETVRSHEKDLRPSVEVSERLLDSPDVDRERLIMIETERSDLFPRPSLQPLRPERGSPRRESRERRVSIQDKDVSFFLRAPPQVSHSSQEEFVHENEEALSISSLIPLDPEIGIGSRKKRQSTIQLPSFLSSSSPRSRLVCSFPLLFALCLSRS